MNLMFAALVGCGGGPDSESSYRDCDGVRTDCTASTCVDVERCDIEKCEGETSYFFDETEYESKCRFEERVTRTTYPRDGGVGRREIRSDIDECFYEAEFDGDDFDEEGRCTNSRECSVETLDCNASDPGDPDCEGRDDDVPCANRVD